jgi:GNAT superfamily N-acetyltransferase
MFLDFDLMLQDWMIPADLAPGDLKSLQRDWSGIEFHCIESPEDPAFDAAFGALWAEFGANSEVEQPTILSRRLLWNGDQLVEGCALRYRLTLLKFGGRFAAVRDHTAIVRERIEGAIVHLSHNLVAPEWRRTGLAGWLRALPIQTARDCLAAQQRPANSPITLVGEMKFLDRNDPSTFVRLKAYEKAGYLMIDPRRINYLQPDFRAPDEIDLGGGPKPLSLALIVRRLGREKELTISGAETLNIAEALYRMYGATFRRHDMAPLIASLQGYPAPDEVIDLLPPTVNFHR